MKVNSGKLEFDLIGEDPNCLSGANIILTFESDVEKR